ncbi:MAG: hypothetical protein F6K24_53905 [Okeania sp. SIO2D1]|nr:hypothetical protein [Okeania sp. SIO2D1]
MVPHTSPPEFNTISQKLFYILLSRGPTPTAPWRGSGGVGKKQKQEELGFAD